MNQVEKMPDALSDDTWLVLNRPDGTVNRVPFLLHFAAIALIAVALVWWIFGGSSSRHLLAPSLLLLGVFMNRLGLRLERKIRYVPCFWLDSNGVHYTPSWDGSVRNGMRLIPWPELSDVKYVDAEYSELHLTQVHFVHRVQIGYEDAQKAISIIREQIAKNVSQEGLHS
ncbi:MAG: hypothetical protein ACREUW_07365 [Burkholderiales bacterium]